MSTAAQPISRRDLFRGRVEQQARSQNSPPWTDSESLSRCTSCTRCIEACPESILSLGQEGSPVVNFSDTGCTFCGACAAACPEGVFAEVEGPAWNVEIKIANKCLLHQGVTCQVCTDFCDDDALSFDLSDRPVGRLQITQDNCTGCGMCVGACPVTAIRIVSYPAEAAP